MTGDVYELLMTMAASSAEYRRTGRSRTDVQPCRTCLREPIPEIEAAARQLENAVAAHCRGERSVTEALFRETDNRILWDWLDSVWGKQTLYNRPCRTLLHPAALPREQRATPRAATKATRRLIHLRDGHYCRFCKIPVIRGEIRAALRKEYPAAIPWGDTNATQHAAFQLMWAQYDHVLPHARGGNSERENVYLTCAACNYGRGNFLLEKFDLLHPRDHPPRQGDWDGLERIFEVPAGGNTIVAGSDPVLPGYSLRV